jgi:N6-L-threonylcarbamoyladenine synthase
MLGLPYPGGPEISKLANEERRKSNDLLNTIILPRPMIHSDNYDFSFSGLKTAVLYMIRDLPKDSLNEFLKKKIAKEFEDAVTEVLVYKTIKAIKEYKTKTLIVGGGVSANTYIKEKLIEAVKIFDKNIKVHFPEKKLSTDNALMIAVAGYFQSQNKKPSKNINNIKAKGNLSL